MNLSRKQFVAVVTALFLASVWWQVIWRLRGEWTGNPQYGFGWFTPVIALGLGWMRWKSRPAPSTNWESGITRSLTWIFLILGMLMWSLTEALFLTNPDWRVTGWISVLGAGALTLGFWLWIGGRSWLLHFAFVSLFLLTAAPWPGRMESMVTLALTDWITGLTVESLNWIGIPALQVGNLIEMKSTHVGVEEACSGIRSLQVTLMASLALGEFHRMQIWTRFKVLSLGVGLTFFSNYCRAFFLAYVAETQGGMEAVDKYHDTAGAAVLLISFVGLGIGAAWMAPIIKRSKKKKPEPPTLPALNKHSMAVLTALVLFSPISWSLGHAWVIWRGAQNQQSAIARVNDWAWDIQTDTVNFEPLEIPEEAQNLLKYDEALSGFIQAGNHPEKWQIYSIKWNPRREVQHQVLGHQPEVCVTAVGWEFEGNTQIFQAEVEGITLPFRQYSFKSGRTRLWVFRCEWEERFNQQPDDLMNHHSRWIAFWEGRLPKGIRMLEFAVQGLEEETAEDRLREILAQVIQVSPEKVLE